MISLIHPSRGRPEKAFETALKWISTAGVPVEYILSIDSDDTLIYEYQKKFLTKNKVIHSNRSAVDAINNAAKISTGNIIIVMSDDFDCPDEWGIKLVNATEGKKDWIAKTPDGVQKWIITLPIMDRLYYDRFGYVYNPNYLHMFCDTEMTCVADLLDRKIHLNIPFIHNHYSTGKSKKDEINERADKTWSQGENVFINRARENFGIKNPVGKIQDPGYVNWINKRV
jgi:glycosyltransferase involved in cell wall biosynthesis